MYRFNYYNQNKKSQSGFTLMEIVVATTIFAVVVSALMSMFNYTLKINRRTEALRQASQSMRDLVEFVAKEVRNGSVAYQTPSSLTGPSPAAVGPCGPAAITYNSSSSITSIANTYALQDNKFAIQTSEGDTECFYLAEGIGNLDSASVGDPLTGASAGSFGSTATNKNPVLAVRKNTLPIEILTSPNVSVQRLSFLVRPLCDPNWSLCTAYGGYPKIQPSITIIAQFRVNLPTGEQTDIYYQTTVSSNNYDIPTH